MLDVLIIGGGPVGLATAAALLQAREAHSIQVYEREEQMRPCGAGVMLKPNGFRALHAIHPELYTNIKNVTSVVDEHIRYMPDGSIRKTHSTKQAQVCQDKYGFPTHCATGWSDLRAALYDFLPAGTVQLGKKFAALQQHDDHVEAHFTDGSVVAARALIGTDGNFSKVRQQTLNDGLPEYTGTTAYRARLSRQGDLPAAAFYQFNLGTMTGLYYPINDDNCVWALHVPDAHLQRVCSSQAASSYKENAQTQANSTCVDKTQANGLEDSLLEQAKKLWGDGPQLLSVAMSRTSPDTVLEHKMHIRHPSSLDRGHWGVGQVSLAGDAAHPMRPTNGQGVNQGFEDAAELGRQVKASGLTAGTLRSYEKTRIARVQHIMAAELASGLRVFTNKSEHIPEDLAKYEFAREVWEEGITPNLAYFDWLLQDPRAGAVHG